MANRRGSLTITDGVDQNRHFGGRINALDEGTSTLGRGFHARQARSKRVWAKEDLYWRTGKEGKPDWAPQVNVKGDY